MSTPCAQTVVSKYRFSLKGPEFLKKKKAVSTNSKKWEMLDKGYELSDIR